MAYNWSARAVGSPANGGTPSVVGQSSGSAAEYVNTTVTFAPNPKSVCGWQFVSFHYQLFNRTTGTTTDRYTTNNSYTFTGADGYELELVATVVYSFIGTGKIMRSGARIIRVADKVLLDI